MIASAHFQAQDTQNNNFRVFNKERKKEEGRRGKKEDKQIIKASEINKFILNVVTFSSLKHNVMF